jgi:hypothetical protein
MLAPVGNSEIPFQLDFQSFRHTIEGPGWTPPPFQSERNVNRGCGNAFPSCYKCSREIGPDNWIQLSGPISRHGKAFPQKPFWRPWARLWFPALRLRFCARALRASGLTWLWPRMALAIRPCARDAAGGWSRSLSPTRSRTHDQWFLWERFSVVLQMQPGNRAGSVFVGTLFRRATNAAGKSGRITGSSYPARFPGCICSTTEKRSHRGVPLKVLYTSVQINKSFLGTLIGYLSKKSLILLQEHLSLYSFSVYLLHELKVPWAFGGSFV